MSLNQRKKVCFVLPTLGAGGAERVMSFVAQQLDTSKFDSILLVVGFEKNSSYAINGIEVVYLNKSRVLTSIPLLCKFFLRRKPEVVVSAIGHLNTIMGLLSLFFWRTKFIGREVNVTSVLKNYRQSKRGIRIPFLMKFSYRLLDKVICQSNDMTEDLKKRFSLKPRKLITINNPITVDANLKDHRNEPQQGVYQLITVGRLAKQKGHLRILKALKKLDFPFHYTIIGDGPERDDIFKVIESYGLSNKVTHIPFSDKVFDYLRRSDLFLQGSYVEGFPNALLESCTVGTPVVVFKALGGIDEIVEEGINGYIARDIEDFSNKVALALNSLQNWNPKVISESVYRKYNKKKILGQYEDLLYHI